VTGDGAVAHRIAWVAFALALIVALAALPGAASAATVKPAAATGQLGPPPPPGAKPTQVIDAQTNPADAGEALDGACTTDMQKCSWVPDIPPAGQPPIQDGWGPPRILGDVLYNCSPTNYAETAVDVSDEREESTSVSETLTLELELGFLGFEETTAEFEAFSKQTESVSTSVSTTNAVAVPPMWKGYNTTSVLSGMVSGDAYITDGINLIQVKDIDMSFPGYAPPGTPVSTTVAYIGNRSPMSPEEIASRCNAVNGLGATKREHATKPRRMTLTVCAKHGRCRARAATGAQLPYIRRADVSLRSHGRTYATGTLRGQKVRLTVTRSLKPGRYTLAIHQPGKRTGFHHRALQPLQTSVPITLR
jgi:hypothetical protein